MARRSISRGPGPTAVLVCCICIIVLYFCILFLYLVRYRYPLLFVVIDKLLNENGLNVTIRLEIEVRWWNCAFLRLEVGYLK